MPNTIYTTNPPTGSPDTIHYYKTCPRLQKTIHPPEERDIEDVDTGTMEVCGDCRERREYNRKQHIGKTGPARQLVDASPDDYPLKTDGGTTIDIQLAPSDATKYHGDAYCIVTDDEVSAVHAAHAAGPGEYAVATLLAPVPGSELPASVERVHGLSYHDAPPGSTLESWLEAYAREHVEDVEAAHLAFDIPTPEADQ